MSLVIKAIQSVTQDDIRRLSNAIDNINDDLRKVETTDPEYLELLAASDKLNELSVDSDFIDDPDCFIATVLAMKYLELKEQEVSNV